jgi:hypothetical protein
MQQMNERDWILERTNEHLLILWILDGPENGKIRIQFQENLFRKGIRSSETQMKFWNLLKSLMKNSLNHVWKCIDLKLVPHPSKTKLIYFFESNGMTSIINDCFLAIKKTKKQLCRFNLKINATSPRTVIINMLAAS